MERAAGSGTGDGPGLSGGFGLGSVVDETVVPGAGDFDGQGVGASADQVTDIEAIRRGPSDSRGLPVDAHFRDEIYRAEIQYNLFS